MRWCHHCRAKKDDVVMCRNHIPRSRKLRIPSTTSPPMSVSSVRVCRKAFCQSCLSRHYDTALDIVCREPCWRCPCCVGLCVCTVCVRKSLPNVEYQLLKSAVRSESSTKTVLSVLPGFSSDLIPELDEPGQPPVALVRRWSFVSAHNSVMSLLTSSTSQTEKVNFIFGQQGAGCVSTR
eukprot:GILJ01010464.1.p1 GENE.GILJ01010464.1~~GILJ01010464.1.p1  ORF type:complete len:179 (+),score=2.78 GILJ01010464.1:215-751(+)